jgi:predicted helicase
MFKKYLLKVAETTYLGDAREESYYGHFSNFLLDFAEFTGKKNIQITVLPKKTEAGNPDFRVWDGKQHVVGYIEAKKPGENLDIIEETEQLLRYRSTFPNLILTDFYEFRLYRNGDKVDSTLLARSFIAKKLKTIPPIEKESKLISLLEKFFLFSLPKVYTAENLAIELAKRTGFLRDEIISKELEEEEKGKGRILGFYQAFNQYLVANLTHEDFADIYAQTITYGLFAARTKAKNGFTRKNAYDLIPQTIGILRDVFQFISLGTVPLQMEVMIDDIAEVLHVADVNKILQEYYRKGKGEDPIVHFYETFLNIYDPTTREKRGVYYTPEPVVKYIVRALHRILKSHFEFKDGLASKGLTLLDPAGGTLTFPAEAIKLAVKEFIKKYGEGGKNKFIKNQLLKNFYAFELMMAPYAIGHIKISFLLEELGYKLQEGDRFKLYLTNTLDMEDLKQTEIPGLGSLSEESHLAAKIKKEDPILVILGNPPYSGISANINKWTEKLLKENLDDAQSYYEVDGNPLNERKLWLQNDYVKFVRFGQWKIQKAGRGIVGMITDNSFIDSPTFRGMRQSLMKSFDEIYILDLHGNYSKDENEPDQNVFDIGQGTVISLFIKSNSKKRHILKHNDLIGTREFKYAWLSKTDFKPRTFKALQPKSPWYFFVPKNIKGLDSYNQWPKVNDIFPIHNVGIVTARDKFAIDNDLNNLKIRIRQFVDLKIEDEIIRQAYNLKDTTTFKLKKFRRELSKVKNWENLFIQVLHKPFDKRHIFYSKWVIERPIYDTMKHLIKINNTALITSRQAQNGFRHAFVSEIVPGFNTTGTAGRYGSGYVFPLYILPNNGEGGNGDLFNKPKVDPEPNISKTIYSKLEKLFKKTLKPEAIQGYVYSVLYSNSYRTKYAVFLKGDFPRIPFTSDYSIFQNLAKFGKELIELHLLKHKSLDKPITKYKGIGDNDKIKKFNYSIEEKRIYINQNKYFDNISEDVWNYYIGSYQVLEKYLKEREDKDLNDPSHFCKVVTSISKTIEIQDKIDKCFPDIENKPINF